MQEKELRRVHRSAGVLVAVFIIIQAFSGAMLSFQFMTKREPFGHNIQEIFELVHFKLGYAGDIYRILLGFGIIWMAVTGVWIYFKIRARSLQK